MSQDTCLTNDLEKTSSQNQNTSTKNLIDDKKSQTYDIPENNATLPDIQKASTESENKLEPAPTKKHRFKGRSYTLGHFWWKKHKEEKKNAELQHKIEEKTKKCEEKNHETASLQNEPGLISADPGQSTNENQCTQVDIRSRLHNLAFIFSLPHLVMLSNLQKLIGIRTGRKPSIQPNDYMDNLLQNARTTMRERGLNNVKLPDQNHGVVLYDGKMTGLDNLFRSGDALLEAETDHFLLSFAIEANNIKANYWWKKQRLKGEVSAVVNQVTMKMKIKQMIQNSPPPELLAFTVEKIDGIHVSIHGLGPLNWIVRRVLRALLRRHLRDFLEREGRDIAQQELQNATLASEGDNLFTMLPQLVMY